MIKNYMEIMVKEVLTDILNNNDNYKDVCKCQMCFEDMMAKSLNNIKPFYITTDRGKKFGESYVKQANINAKVILEVMNSIECVSSNKRHD